MSEPKASNPDQSGEARLRFERLYRDWMLAKASASDPDLLESDADTTARCRHYDIAERALLAEPAPFPWAVWKKFEVLDFLVTDEADSGEFGDKRVVFALGSIKADILRFGLVDPADRP